MPMLMFCPELFRGGTVVSRMVANLDIAPTILAAAGVEVPTAMVGGNMIPLGQGRDVAAWRTELLYGTYWRANFPQTPTLHALRESRYKDIRARMGCGTATSCTILRPIRGRCGY